MDDHRKITDYLKSIKEQFFVLDAPSSRAQKIVIKGLSEPTDIVDIKTDLESQSYTIEKVAQLTKTKTKLPLPIFMVETKKFPNSPDILKELTKCCYMKVSVDTFRKRPGATQCCNCKWFHHSSVSSTRDA
ncbi:hypothetical protein TNCT_715591 [Trichonephila clavata]|uniref:Pre-C2HC domain-containing protein n=1 Tax=Trichonephila clavata TaxID=2740835 RepID=A0A8X6GI36_TRICU|nr:hypothetical protein TNCT_715591 [Trichonephila clavata]